MTLEWRELMNRPVPKPMTSTKCMFATRACLAAIAILLVGCTQASRSAAPSGPVAKVYVTAEGSILLNGSPTTLGDLRVELKKLKAANGSVWYSRANPQGDPPPQAMDVIAAIANEALPARLLEKNE